MICINAPPSSLTQTQTQYDPLRLLYCGAKQARRSQAQKRSLQLGSPLGSSSFIGRGSSLSPNGVYRESSSGDGALSLLGTRAYAQLSPAHVVCSSTGHTDWANCALEPTLCRDSAGTGDCLFRKRGEGGLGQLGNTHRMCARTCALNPQRGFGQLRSMRRICVRTRAFNPQNGGSGGRDSVGRVIINLAGAGLLTYLTVTGRLNWLFDAIFALWLVSAVVWWFAERSLIKGPCPNCGGEFQVFEFSLKDEHQLCPYCSQPFKLENKRFVRDEPQFSNQQTRGFNQPFGGFEDFDRQASSRKREDSSGVIVDIEAEVRDKD